MVLCVFMVTWSCEDFCACIYYMCINGALLLGRTCAVGFRQLRCNDKR